jgi:hypothetical protein
MRDRAKFAGVGTHYVISIPEGRVRAYEVYSASGFLEVQLITAPILIQDAAKGLEEIYQKSGGTMKLGIRVRARDLAMTGLGGASAYDIVNDFNLRERVAHRLAVGSIPSASYYINQAIQAALAIAGAASGTVLDITIEFDGGSESTYRLVVGHSKAEYVTNSSLNEDGNAIPEANAREYAGSWHGPNTSGIIQQLVQLGAQMSGSGGSVKCTWDSTRNTLTCVIRSF